MPREKIDPKLAQDIEDDMDELDNKPKAAKSTVKGEVCPDCADSIMGPGLLDAHTICPTCQGTGKVAVLE